MRDHLAKIIAGLCGAALVAACGSQPGAGANDGAAATATADAPAAAGAMPANWNATDACSIIDKATMGEVLGAPVTETALGLVHEPGTADAGTSECTYTLADGRATVMTRWSPINDNVEGSINAARSAAKQVVAAFGKGTVEDIPDLGKASIWVDGIGQLQTFIDDARMVMITVPSRPDAKNKAVALARKAGA
ncbi:hypothetical protein [Sphingomonas sp.]|uniref:hypothetical protein n=1 Tax=Sphingomonas sp. TaxID=28214 RepID=UPI002B9EE897|nr:hypothetical protein [Sphingomonas sp.]HWK36848.1 hypothetical protein [Sphingomonas sp.]